MASAFQASAFQNNAFQIDGAVRSWGDDAPRLIRVHEYREEKPEPKPKRKAKRVIVPATGWPFDLETTTEALPQYAPDIPRAEMADEVALQAAIQRHLMRKTEQYLADEDDEEVALLLALD